MSRVGLCQYAASGKESEVGRNKFEGAYLSNAQLEQHSDRLLATSSGMTDYHDVRYLPVRAAYQRAEWDVLLGRDEQRERRSAYNQL